MKRKSNDQPLKEVLEAYVKAFRLEDGLNQAAIESIWEEMMGSGIAKRTKEIRYRDGKLLIRVDSSVLREELSYQKEKLMKHLNDELKNGVIKEIILR